MAEAPKTKEAIQALIDYYADKYERLLYELWTDHVLYNRQVGIKVIWDGEEVVLEKVDNPEDERLVKAIHITPSGSDGHTESVSCWCEPECVSKEPEQGLEVWRHK